MVLEIYELDTAYFPTAPGLEQQATLNNKISEYRSFSWYRYVINDIKRYQKGIYGANHRYLKTNYKYVKGYDKNKKSSYLKYFGIQIIYIYMGNVTNVYGFKWVEAVSEFNEDLIKTCNNESDEGYFLEVAEGYFLEFDVRHPEI